MSVVDYTNDSTVDVYAAFPFVWDVVEEEDVVHLGASSQDLLDPLAFSYDQDVGPLPHVVVAHSWEASSSLEVPFGWNVAFSVHQVQ